jgi:hypothetical protein
LSSTQASFRAVHHDVVGPDEIERVFGRDARVVDDDFAVRIDAVKGFLRRLGLRAADVRVGVENLPLQI